MTIDFASIIPGLFIFAAAVLTAHLIACYTNFYAHAVTRTAMRRYEMLEGLRGFLALGVFLSHCSSAYFWFHTGRWTWPPSTFYMLCGTVPVCLFFMITGLLFWRKAVADPGKIDIKVLYASRLRRLAPMYVFCLLITLLIVAVRTHWTLRVSPAELISAVLAWSALGMFGQPDINGLIGTKIINPALWTLSFEWLFYLSLPFFSFFATSARFVVIAFVGVLVPLISPFGFIALCFLIGMTLAQLEAARPLPSALKSRKAAMMAVLSLFASPLICDGDFGVVASLLAMPLFVVAVAGNDLFGILRRRELRLLGLVSYSTYVIHGVVLQIVLGAVNSFTLISLMDAATYWGMQVAIGSILVMISALTYRWVEHPFMHKQPTISNMSKPSVPISESVTEP